MEHWQGHLHFGLRGEYVLFHRLRLDSLTSFLIAALLTVVVCIFERAISYVLSTQWSPFPRVGRTGTRLALWRTALFWLASLLRLTYMLIAMSFNAGLILILVTSLSAGQFVVEILEATPTTPSTDFDLAEEPLLLHPPSNHNTGSVFHSLSARARSPRLNPSPSRLSSRARPKSRTNRTKSKPAQIYIHPSHSNFARADAFAMQRGLKLGGVGRTVYDVASGSGSGSGSGSSGSPETEIEHESEWKEGKGQEVARKMMLGNAKQRRSSSDSMDSATSTTRFKIGDEDEED